MPIIKAVIFDSDGTLVDTTRLIIEGFKQVLVDFGYKKFAIDEIVIQDIGGHIADVFSAILSLPPTSEIILSMVGHLDVVQDEIASEMIKPYPHEKETLNRLKALKIKIGLFTSGTPYQVQRNFNIVGINATSTFDSMITQVDMVASKPSPEGLLLCAKKLGVSVDNIMYVGDHSVDISAGRSAHVALTVGISHGFHQEVELRTAGADKVIHDLKELLELIT